MKLSIIILGLIIVTAIGLFIPQTGFGQSQKLGIVNFTPPKDWAKTPKDNIVSFTDIKTTGHFCIITLYGATKGSGNPKNDFAREWKNLVTEPFQAEANPDTETSSEDGWTITTGGSIIEFQGNKSMAFLTVYSGFEKTVSVLGVFNDPAYVGQLTAVVSSINIDKTSAVTSPPVQPNQNQPQMENGKLVIPLPNRQLSISDLAGEWGQNDGINTTYVYRSSGSYAGTDSLHFSNEMVITGDGGFSNDHFAIKNGRTNKEQTSGTASINGRVLTITQKGTVMYVIRGWLELPDITILVICGPIDESRLQEHLDSPDKGFNLDAKWVRKK